VLPCVSERFGSRFTADVGTERRDESDSEVLFRSRVPRLIRVSTGVIAGASCDEIVVARAALVYLHHPIKASNLGVAPHRTQEIFDSRSSSTSVNDSDPLFDATIRSVFQVFHHD